MVKTINAPTYTNNLLAALLLEIEQLNATSIRVKDHLGLLYELKLIALPSGEEALTESEMNLLRSKKEHGEALGKVST